MKVWKKVVVVLVVLMSLAVVTVMVGAGKDGNNGTKIPFNFEEEIPCAAGGAGETVHFTGYKHWFVHTTVDNNGGHHHKVHLSHKLSGVGEKTGDQYQMVGAGNDYNFNFPPNEHDTAPPSIASVVVTRRIIGKGQAVDMLFHETAHLTVNANGEEVVDFRDLRITCK